MSNFKVGDRVGLNVSLDEDDYDIEKVEYKYSSDDDPCYGEILSLHNNEFGGEYANVKWDTDEGLNFAEQVEELDDLADDENDGSFTTCKLSDLLPEQELRDLHESLSEGFDKLIEDIEAKMQSAAALIREAQELAATKNETVADLVSAYSSIFPAMDEAGWNTSSFGC